MNCSFRVCLAAWVLVINLLAQTKVDLQTQSKTMLRNLDFSTAASTKTVKTGAGLPTTCSAGEVFFDTSASPGANLYVCPSVNVWSATGRRVPVTTLAGLPSSCAAGDLFFVTDISFTTGGWNLYTCGSTNTFSQAGVQADGTGYLIVTCNAPSTCLVGPNLAVLPTLTGPNAFLGASDFSGASKTAMFRLAETPPSTCDATGHEAYFNTTSNSVEVCSATDTWTPIGGTSGSFLLYYKTNVAALTATGAQQTLDSFTIPAGKLRVGDVVEIEATFARTGTAAPMTFGVSFGGSAMQSIAIPTSVGSATYKPALTITGAATEVWSGVVMANGANPTVIASSANATADISSPIIVSLTQNGTGPDTGAVVSWFVKVTR